MTSQSAEKQAGYLLVAVATLLAMLAALALVLNRESVVTSQRIAGEFERQQLELIAQSALEHARWIADNSDCESYALPPTTFGAGSYEASFTPTSSSPITIVASARLANGTVATRTRERAAAHWTERTLTLPAAANGGDTYIDADASTSNFGDDGSLPTAGPGDEERRILVRFDLGDLPDKAQIRSARLELFAASTSGNDGLVAHRITRSWIQGDGAVGATWTSYDGVGPWATPGGDFDPQVLASGVPQKGDWLRLELAPLVRAWHDGTFANEGVLLRQAGSGEASYDFTSAEGDPATQPRLVVDYTCDCSTAAALGDATVTATRDTYALAALPDAGYATEALRVGAGARSLIGFDTGVTPLGAVLRSATLSLAVTQLDRGGTLAVHPVTRGWHEGTCNGAGCTDGATWQRTGTRVWSAAGFDFEALPTAAVLVESVGELQLDLTPLAREWLAGTRPNHGIALLADGALESEIGHREAASANERPRLLIEYECPCRSQCPPIAGAGAAGGSRLLMVVVDPGDLTVQENAKQAMLESWGYRVMAMAEDAPQTAFDTAFSNNDVIFVTEDVGSAALASKLTPAPIGVVTEEGNLSDELGIADSIGWESATALEIVDNTHYITEPFAIGPLPIASTPQSLYYLTGGQAPALRRLGHSVSGYGLVTIDAGDAILSGGAAAGRRAMLPWGGNDFDIAQLNADALTLFGRALQWAAGADVAATETAPVPGYLDRFDSAVCDGAVAYTGSHGDLDWSPWPWTEASENDGPCAGAVQVGADPEVSDGASFRLQVRGTGVSLTRAVDLSVLARPELSFDYRFAGYQSGDFFRLRVSTDGGVSWIKVDRWDGPFDQAAYSTATFDLQPYQSATAVIKLEFEGLGATRTSYFDNMAIAEAGDGGGDGGGGDGGGGGGGGSSPDYYLDAFRTLGFDGDDGTLNWSTAWLEVNESDGFGEGDIQVGAFAGATYALRLRDNDGGGEGVQRRFDLSSCATASLRFDYYRDKLDTANDNVRVEISADGGATWTELTRVAGPDNDSSFRSTSHAIAAPLTAAMIVRLLTSSTLSGQDNIYIDNLRIDCFRDAG